MGKPDTWLAYSTAEHQTVSNGSIRLSPYLRRLVRAEDNRLEIIATARGATGHEFLHLDPKSEQQYHNRQRTHGGQYKYRPADPKLNDLFVARMQPGGKIILPESHYKHIGVAPTGGQIVVCGVFDHIDIVAAHKWNNRISEEVWKAIDRLMISGE